MNKELSSRERIRRQDIAVILLMVLYGIYCFAFFGEIYAIYVGWTTSSIFYLPKVLLFFIVPSCVIGVTVGGLIPCSTRHNNFGFNTGRKFLWVFVVTLAYAASISYLNAPITFRMSSLYGVALVVLNFAAAEILFRAGFIDIVARFGVSRFSKIVVIGIVIVNGALYASLISSSNPFYKLNILLSIMYSLIYYGSGTILLSFLGSAALFTVSARNHDEWLVSTLVFGLYFILLGINRVRVGARRTISAGGAGAET